MNTSNAIANNAELDKDPEKEPEKKPEEPEPEDKEKEPGAEGEPTWFFYSFSRVGLHIDMLTLASIYITMRVPIINIKKGTNATSAERSGTKAKWKG